MLGEACGKSNREGGRERAVERGFGRRGVIAAAVLWLGSSLQYKRWAVHVARGDVSALPLVCGRNDGDAASGSFIEGKLFYVFSSRCDSPVITAVFDFYISSPRWNHS